MRHFLAAVALCSSLGTVAANVEPQASATPQNPTAAAKPLPEGSRVAYMNPQRIIVESGMGKASTAKINALRSQKMADLDAKNKELEAAQQKVAAGSLLSEAARTAAQRAVDRLQLELQRAQQDAEAAVQELQQQANEELERALTPLLERVALDKGIHMLLRGDTGTIAWADPSLDLTGEIIKRLDIASVKPPK